MTETWHEELMETLAGVFGNRLRRTQRSDEVSVSPVGVEEVRRLAEIAGSHSVPLVPLGAGTGDGPRREGGILVRFDLMRGVRLPEDDEPSVEAGPGASWLELDDELRARSRGPAAYPTSAPRATVGGWVATDGLGVGSFEFGWLRENVLSASVVLAGDELHEVPGEDLGSIPGAGDGGAIVVGARLKTRRADADAPFAAAFGDAEDLAAAVEGVAASRPPLWHLAFMNPALARARHLGEGHLPFGAYPREGGRRGRRDPARGRGGPPGPPPRRGGRAQGVGRAVLPRDAFRSLRAGSLPGGPTPVGNPRCVDADGKSEHQRCAGLGLPFWRGAVAFVRGGRAVSEMPIKILAATDGGPEARSAVRMAADLYARAGSELYLVHVGEVPLMYHPEMRGYPSRHEMIREQAGRLLDEETDRLRSAVWTSRTRTCGWGAPRSRSSNSQKSWVPTSSSSEAAASAGSAAPSSAASRIRSCAMPLARFSSSSRHCS